MLLKLPLLFKVTFLLNFPPDVSWLPSSWTSCLPCTEQRPGRGRRTPVPGSACKARMRPESGGADDMGTCNTCEKALPGMQRKAIELKLKKQSTMMENQPRSQELP
eukprot:323760-Pelagomonas_calceolata.AAC.5